MQYLDKSVNILTFMVLQIFVKGNMLENLFRLPLKGTTEDHKFTFMCLFFLLKFMVTQFPAHGTIKTLRNLADKIDALLLNEHPQPSVMQISKVET